MLVEGCIGEKTHPKSAGEVDFQCDLLVASRDAQGCQSDGHGKEKKETYIAKPRRMCSRCIVDRIQVKWEGVSRALSAIVWQSDV